MENMEKLHIDNKQAAKLNNVSWSLYFLKNE